MYGVLCVHVFNLQKWYCSRIAFVSSSFDGMCVCALHVVPLHCPLFCSVPYSAVLLLVMDPGDLSSAQCHLERRPWWKVLWDVYPEQDCSVPKHTWSQLSRSFDENGYAALYIRGSDPSQLCWQLLLPTPLMSTTLRALVWYFIFSHCWNCVSVITSELEDLVVWDTKQGVECRLLEPGAFLRTPNNPWTQ